ncbi:MAG: uroporphyrinogen III methyltransferase/synthase [Verrucomicrobiales bacterium]|jgi:uroporphyrinogen III methyltransferase/synthase
MTNQDTLGICYLVGAGPGDIGLVTLRAKECVEIADVIVYDYLSNPEMLRWAKPGAELIYAGKKAADHTLTQDEINALLVERTREGKVVTRLKGGDPMIFGRGGEEAEDLVEAGLAFEIVPGISSTIAGPAYAGIPVTHRACNAQLTIFTGHEDPTKAESTVDYAAIGKAPGTKVMLMGVQRLGKITDAMIAGGVSPDERVALVRWATTGQQKTLIGTVKDIAEKVISTGFKAPAVAVFGEVVRYHEKINWFENRPLFGKRIVVTRTRKQAGVLSQRLRLLGADVYELPTIRIEPPKDMLDFAEFVRDAHTYDWLVFTSPNGVESFFDVYYKIYKDARSIGGVRIAAVGPGTAQKIHEFHLDVDLLPEKHTAEGLVQAFKKDGDVENLNFLWVKAETTREVIGEELIKMGAILDEAVAYRTVPETDDVTGARARFEKEGADLITFTSASTVDCFMALGLPLPKDIKVASIGPITSEAVVRHGLDVDIDAEEHTIPGLVAAILESKELLG